MKIKINPTSCRGRVLLAIEEIRVIDGRKARYADIAEIIGHDSYGSTIRVLRELDQWGYIKRYGRGDRHLGARKVGRAPEPQGGVTLLDPAKDWLARHWAPQTQREAV